MHIIADYNTGEFLRESLRIANRSERFRCGRVSPIPRCGSEGPRGNILAPSIAVPDSQGRR